MFLIVLVIIPRMGASPSPLVFSVVLWIDLPPFPVSFFYKRFVSRLVLVSLPLPPVIYLRALWMLFYILFRSSACTDPAFAHHSEFAVFHLIEHRYRLESFAPAALLMLHTVYDLGFVSHAFPLRLKTGSGNPKKLFKNAIKSCFLGYQNPIVKYSNYYICVSLIVLW